jgi:hypothetical protein
MNSPARAGCVIGAIGLLSVVGLSLSGGTLGSCGPSSPWVLVALLLAFICFPSAALFLIIGLFVHLHRKPTALTELGLTLKAPSKSPQ